MAIRHITIVFELFNSTVKQAIQDDFLKGDFYTKAPLGDQIYYYWLYTPLWKGVLCATSIVHYRQGPKGRVFSISGGFGSGIEKKNVG